jgi:hypothetical protein
MGPLQINLFTVVIYIKIIKASTFVPDIQFPTSLILVWKSGAYLSGVQQERARLPF